MKPLVAKYAAAARLFERLQQTPMVKKKGGMSVIDNPVSWLDL